MEERKIEGLLGICRKAGKMTVGTPPTLDALRSGKKPFLVLIASDASQNTVKRVTNCCTHYGTDHRFLHLNAQELGHRIGKSGCVAAIGITDAAFADAILKLMKGQGDSGI